MFSSLIFTNDIRCFSIYDRKCKGFSEHIQNRTYFKTYQLVLKGHVLIPLYNKLKLFFVTLDVYARGKETMQAYAFSKIIMMILIGFYMRSVLVHISPSNALFR